MSAIHVHHIPTHVISQRPNGDPRWCFYCRKRVPFTLTVHAPDDLMSYYGPHADVKCPRGHMDGDLFPGRIREWSE